MCASGRPCKSVPMPSFTHKLSPTHPPLQSVVNFEVQKDLSQYTVLHIPLRDDVDANLLAQLPAAYSFLHEALTAQPPGRVLVHCQAGQSRSIALAAAYLMKSQGWGAEEVGCAG